jgi:hypothetical protein
VSKQEKYFDIASMQEAPMSDRAKELRKLCPRCSAEMRDVVSIAPVVGEPGLIAYECSQCRYVMSELLHPVPTRDDT